MKRSVAECDSGDGGGYVDDYAGGYALKRRPMRDCFEGESPDNSVQNMDNGQFNTVQPFNIEYSQCKSLLMNGNEMEETGNVSNTTSNNIINNNNVKTLSHTRHQYNDRFNGSVSFVDLKDDYNYNHDYDTMNNVDCLYSLNYFKEITPFQQSQPVYPKLSLQQMEHSNEQEKQTLNHTKTKPTFSRESSPSLIDDVTLLPTQTKYRHGKTYTKHPSNIRSFNNSKSSSTFISID